MSAKAEATDLAINLTTVERVTLRTPLVALGEYRCPPDDPHFAGGGPHTCPYVVFPRSCVEIRTARGGPTVCTPAIVNFWNIGDNYTRRVVSPEGDQCDWIAVSPALLQELLSASGHPEARADSRYFRAQTSLVGSGEFLAQRRIFSRVVSQPQTSALEAEESVLRLIQSVLEEASSQWFGAAPPRHVPRNRAERNRRKIATDALELLAFDFRNNRSLTQIAQSLDCSPGHLARSFRLATGTSLHAYRTRLRLRASLPLLDEYRHNLTSLALILGFASHSHFTEAFHRCYGLAPTEMQI